MKNQFTQTTDRIRQLGLAALLTTGLAAHAQPGLYTSGHGDVRMTYDTSASSLYFHYQLDYNAVVDGASAGTFPNPVSFAPHSLITFVPDLSIARPASSSFNFLGNNAGAPLWLIPQVQDFGKPWLGFSSEDLKAADWSGSLQLSLVEMTGPAGGHFALWTTGTFGTPTVRFDTADGVGADDVFNYSLNTHSHYNWGFTEPGLYDLTFKVVGTHQTDGVKEATGTFTVAVAAIPEPAAGALLGVGLMCCWRRFQTISKSRQLPPTKS